MQTYTKVRLMQSEVKEMRERGQWRCPGKWCPDLPMPASDLLSSGYCRFCTSQKSKQSYKMMKRRAETGEETPRMKRRRLISSVPDGYFLCASILCRKENEDGMMWKNEERRRTNVNTCTRCEDYSHAKYIDSLHELRKPEGSICIVCGETDRRFMQQNHKDGTKKDADVSRDKSTRWVMLELKKTERMCMKCHRGHTLKQRRKIRKNYVELSQKSHASAVESGEPLRKCAGMLCKPLGRKMPYSEFTRASHTPDGLKYRCRHCCGEKDQSMMEINRQHLNAIMKKIGKCLDCGYLVVDEDGEWRGHHFDFDHINPPDKIIAVSQLVGRCFDARSRIDAEVAKCRFLCCNCHEIRTIEQLGWKRCVK